MTNVPLDWFEEEGFKYFSAVDPGHLAAQEEYNKRKNGKNLSKYLNNDVINCLKSRANEMKKLEVDVNVDSRGLKNFFVSYSIGKESKGIAYKKLEVNESFGGVYNFVKTLFNEALDSYNINSVRKSSNKFSFIISQKE